MGPKRMYPQGIHHLHRLTSDATRASAKTEYLLNNATSPTLPPISPTQIIGATAPQASAKTTAAAAVFIGSSKELSHNIGTITPLQTTAVATLSPSPTTAKLSATTAAAVERSLNATNQLTSVQISNSPEKKISKTGLAFSQRRYK